MLTPKTSTVTHRRGRGWRGGYLGSAVETYLYVFLQGAPAAHQLYQTADS